MASADTSFFGHPRGLSTLFFTEMWERFSYYGMRAILILFMTAPAATGGLGFTDAKAAAVYGIYTSAVYLMSLPGGWIADRFLGLRRCVILGGILIALGEFLLAVPGEPTFYSGLIVIILGTGLLKPNASTLVGTLYQENDVRRDSGFTIFYIGINVGAFLAPFIVGGVGQKVNWNYGFALAGIGMVLGVIQFLWGTKHLKGAGEHPVPPKDAADAARQRRMLMAFIGALTVTIAAIAVTEIDVIRVADALGGLLLLTFFVVFGFLLSAGDWTTTERNRILVIGVLVLAAAIFWSIFEQAGSTLNLFADRNTDNRIFGWEFPSSYFQSLNSFYLFGLGPLFAALWLKLGSRNPSPPLKFALGLILAGLGFLWLVGGAAQATGGNRVSPIWLAGIYLFTTAGEMLLSPVGLSTMTKLAPTRVAGFMMGVWFLSNSMGNYLGGRMAAFYRELPLTTLFGLVAAFGIGFGVLLLMMSRPITRLMGGVK